MNLPIIYKLVRIDYTQEDTFKSLTDSLVSVNYKLNQWTETKDLEFSLLGFSSLMHLTEFSHGGYGEYFRPILRLDVDYVVLKCLTDSIVYFSLSMPTWNLAEIFEDVESYKRQMETLYFSFSFRSSKYRTWRSDWPAGTVFCRRTLPLENYGSTVEVI